MPLILGANSVSGYTVKNSLRFNSGSSDSLTRTLGTFTSRDTFTVSAWVKAPSGTPNQIPIVSFDGSNQYMAIRYSTGFNLDPISYQGSTIGRISSSALYRDVSAWYHVVVAIDSTQATSSNRMRSYVNGVEVTSFSSSTYPTQNTDMISSSMTTVRVGAGVDQTGATSYFGGYMSEVYYIDGQQLTPSSFGETDEDTGIWKPKAYTGTYGTNGFYLQFKNSASLGTDSSGNGNTFTVNNLTSIDQTTDTPTNNFCTLNPLYYGVNRTITEGNLKVVGTTTAWSNGGQGTIGVTAGKWYMEAKVSDADGDTGYCFGWGDQAVTYTGGVVSPTKKAYNRQYQAFYNNQTATNSYFTTVSAGDILMCAFDLDNGKIWFGKNGTWQNSNGTALNTTYSSTTLNPSYPDTTGITIDTTGAGVYTPNSAVYNDGYVEWNFGNPIYSANAYQDANGFGNFSYSVPSGFYAVCTKNLYQYGF